MSALGREQTFAAQEDIHFIPNRDRESGFLQKVMSASPLKADRCGAKRNVSQGPQADSATNDVERPMNLSARGE
jgi:hypothetical protein